MKHNALISLTVAVALGLSSFYTNNSAHAENYNSVNVIIDGVTQTFEQSALVVDDTTMVPMRAIFERLGATIVWDSASQSVNATSGKTTIKLTIGNDTAYINGTAVKLAAKPQLINSNTMVPLRFVSEALGCTVDWDSSTDTAIIDTIPSATPTPPVSKYTDPNTYLDPEKYDRNERGVNEIVGFDLAGAINDVIMKQFMDQLEKEYASEQERLAEEKRITAEKDKLQSRISTTSDSETLEIWNAYSVADKTKIWEVMEYKSQYKIYNLVSVTEQIALWKYTDVQNETKLFDLMTNEQKLNVWYLGANNDTKQFLFIQLRFIDETKPMDWWYYLSIYERVGLYKIMYPHNRPWIDERIPKEELDQILDLINNPPKSNPTVDETGAVG